MVSAVEQVRLHVSKNTEAHKKSQWGQFFTPASTARFMAGLFRPSLSHVCRLLDPGAGIGSLSCAFLERYASDVQTFKSIALTAYEQDSSLHSDLGRMLSLHAKKLKVDYETIGGDFIEASVNHIQFGGKRFTHVIANPPYKKIHSGSAHRQLLREVGIETVNLYSAFIALAVEQMEQGGQMVTIIPRSFCNGPYYRPFRNLLLKQTAIRHIHLFDSRTQGFKDDDVLQENIILLLERGGKQDKVTISTSTDNTFCDLKTQAYPFECIVSPDDSEKFIHIPTTGAMENIPALSSTICYSLDELGLKVSTGPVVDFRLKEHLREMPDADTVPLLYPGHFCDQILEWPRLNFKKPNAIVQNAETEKWLYPTGYYCVTRRFSSKEEKRRIMASVVSPEAFPQYNALGFENHLNVFHENKHGLSEELARGLAVFLNSMGVDECFRRFNGHTQVNATDLKQMKYPSRTALIALGKWAIKQNTESTQNMLDEQLEKLIA
ncbi:TPA: SAM-dependent methyltransferase [Candidatus Sumerlaeota bacterium]|jgi:adenine-specific DNA-methyltransferase|nr:SAM-dependent methyltransferase [Candidatus Sumerlaeota bacterium]